MKLIITIKRPNARPVVVEGVISPTMRIEDARKAFEAEQLLNSLPTNLRVHISVEGDLNGSRA